MKRTLEDIRENLEWVGCDNETVLELCAEVERLNSVVAKLTRDCNSLEDDVRYNGELLARANEMKGELDRLRAIVDRQSKALNACKRELILYAGEHPYDWDDGTADAIAQVDAAEKARKP